MLNQGVWTFLAGLALFLYAVSGIESSVKGLAGRSFKKFLFRQTSQPVRAVFGGAVVTAFLQSSSVVLLITLSFVGAGILPIRSALALSLGANLGTTFDSWLIAWLGFKFDIESFSFPILALSLFLRLAGSRRPVLLEWARFLFSIALLFLSLAFMKSSIDPKGAEHSLLGISTWSSYVFVPVGFLLTAVIQSSFATMTIGLAALDGGVLGLMQAACLVLGAEAGTAVKFLFSWRSDTIEARRMSLGNLFINLVTVMIGLVIVATSGLTSLSSFFPADPLYLLVAFQTGVNLFSALLFLPFITSFGEWLERVLPDPSTGRVLSFTKTKSDGSDPSYDQLHAGLVHLLDCSEALVRRTVGVGMQEKENGVSVSFFQRIFHRKKTFADDYKAIKQLHGVILEELSDRLAMESNPEELEKWNGLVVSARNLLHVAKTVKDIRVDLKELAASANDDLFGRLAQVRQETMRFLESTHQKVSIEEALQVNRQWHDAQVESAMELLRLHRIRDMEASTLVNVYHELYSSRKALIRARRQLASR